MDRPLEIAFHNQEPSAEIESLIRERVAKLEKLYPRIVGCRVSVARNHRQHRNGNIPDVRIEIDVPGKRIAISREPHGPKQNNGEANVRDCLRHAFDAAARRLRSYKRVQAREVKAHPGLLAGVVTRITLRGDFGFISTTSGTDLYFHRNSVIDGSFESLDVGDAVRYIEGEGDTGPTAAKVWRASPGRPH